MSAGGDNPHGALRVLLADLPAPARGAALLAHVCTRAAALLGVAPEAIAPDAPWTELGFDSLRAVDLRSDLAHALDLPLRSTLLFDHPQPQRLVAHLLEQLAFAPAAAAAGVAAAPCVAATTNTGIAIVGAACRFPGAESLGAFERLLADGGDAVAPIPRERFDVDALHDADPQAPGGIYVRDAALLRDIDRFDAAFFGISPREAEALDPQQRLLLEVAWHALEHANLTPAALADRRVGVYVGTRASEYFDSQTARTIADANAYQHSGNALSTAAGRLSYTFGFTGPCYAIDTACSGSLVAVHVAARALRAGECDVAVVGGVNAILDPLSMAGLCRARMLSRDGRCKTFDAAADGYGRGEGCGVVVLQRLADAQREGQRVLAVVAGTAVNQDGRSSGLTVPNGGAQIAVVRDALADAGVGPDAIAFVEAHGTGTALGDPIEVGALDAVFGARAQPLPVGSVKTNIGHLEPAAGIAGLLKAVLALRARTLPRHLHCRTPNPHVDWSRSIVRIAHEPVALATAGELHAGVSSFGFSGTNCHVIVRSTAADAVAVASAPTVVGPWLLPLQANDRDALRELAAAHADALARDGAHGDLAAWCHAAAVGRAALPVRAAFVARDASELAAALRAFAAGDESAAAAAGHAPAQPPVGRDDGDVRALRTQREDRGARAASLAALARSWTSGVPADLAHANDRGPARATLPAYPFQRRRFWFAAPTGAAAARRAPRTLLGEARATSLLAAGQTLFANELAAGSPPWLADHKALGRVLLPLAGMLEMALAAETAAGSALPLAVRAATARTGLELGDHPLAIESLRTAAGADASFGLKSRAADGSWRAHFECGTGAHTAPAVAFDLATVRSRCRAPIPAAAFYGRAEALQFQYGPAFRGVRGAWVGDGEAIAEVELPAGLDARAFVIHPALLDACLQAVLAVLPPDTSLFLPRRVQSFVVHRAGAARAWSHVRVRPGDGADRLVDYVLADDDGRTIAELQGLQLVPADPARRRRAAAPPDPLHHVAWQPAPLGAAHDLPARIGLAGWPALAHALRERLPAGSARVVDAADLDDCDQRFDVVLWLAGPDAADDRDPLRAQERLLGGALELVRAAARAPGPPRLGLVTHGVQAARLAPPAGVPHASTLLGLWRTVAHEHAALRPFAVDLDPLVPGAAVAEHAHTLAAELADRGDEPEVAWRGGERRARRLRRGAAPADHLTPPAGPFRTRAAEYGSFEHLAFVPVARRDPGPHEVEVAMTAAGLNFKDVLHARGLLRELAAAHGVQRASEQPLGFEGSGVVTAVGARVQHLRPGDRAVVLATDSLASHVTAPADHVLALPAGVDAFAAAGAPVVFATARHALFDLARVRAGETVLVHAAAGGVGQAAVQLLRAAGCRVLATASAPKRALVEALGAELVGDSRRTGFAAGVAAATGGRGADVVLNTLTGDTVAASLSSLARGGRFVELGVLGVWSEERVRAERPDVAFAVVDFGRATAREPGLLPRLLAQLRDDLAAARVRLRAPTIAPLAQVRGAFQHLASGRSTGKVVVALPPAVALRADRTCLLTGASGGAAPAIAAALVDAGARHLALLARTAPALDAPWVARLRDRGCAVAAVAADVADRDALQKALAAVRAQGPPLGGVVHAAGALADGTLASLQWQHAAGALRAKVAGTIWLDELTATDPLEFFVLTSSMAATLGNAGQAAYAAANAFVDAFAAARRARGLPAAAIAFGPWDGDGMTGRLPEPMRARLRARGIALLAPAAAGRLLVEHRAASHEVAVLPVNWAEWLAPFGDAAPAACRELRAAARPPARSAAADLEAKAPADPRDALRRVVSTHVALALGFAGPEPLGQHVTFRDLGLDSLLAIEAKDRLERALGRTLPATLLFDHPDVERLVAHLLATAPANGAEPFAR